MSVLRIHGFCLAGAAALLVMGCAAGDDAPTLHGPEADGAGSISLALSDGSVTSAVTGGQVTSFRVRFFDTVPTTVTEDPYFYSECWPASAGFTVDHLKVAKDYTVVYEGYTDTTCAASALATFGLRGGVDIQEAGSGDAYYYIQVNRKGASTAFPLPDSQLNPTKGGYTCTTDDDCRQLIDCPDKTCRFGKYVACDMPTTNCECPTDQPKCAKGQKFQAYVVHPSAICDKEGGSVCRLPSLFPLNSREGRAFHAALSTPDGKVTLYGGFNSGDAVHLSVRTPQTDAFNGSTSLFFQSPADDTKDEFGLATVVLAGAGRKMIVLGGASTVGVQMLNGVAVPAPGPETCSGPDQCVLAATSVGAVVDLVNGTVTQSVLPFSTVGALATVVPSADKNIKVFVRTGLVLNSGTTTSVGTGTSSYLCTVAAGDAIECALIGVAGAGVARGGSAGICLVVSSGEGCKEFLILGGNRSDAGPNAFAEVYLAADGTVKNLTGDATLPPTLYLASAVRLGGRVWTFGGATSWPADPDAPTYIYTVDSAKGSITGQYPVVDTALKPDLLRVFHQVTALSDGKTVLMTGGLAPGGKATATARRFTADGAVLTAVGSTTLTSARLGHSATLITGGLLDGAVLISGGLTGIDQVPRFAAGSELFLP